jgi:topoisomerase-4 subunit B
LRLFTTHDWSEPVDVRHIEAVLREARRWVDCGIEHLVLEVLAYAVDEAAEGSTRSIDVLLGSDGSIVVADDGRGTDTRQDVDGTWQVKPIMSTADLRFYGVADAPLLADGHARSGMSVVAACSSWLQHTNLRSDSAWSARYESGMPVGAPAPIPVAGTTGTSVRFRPDPRLFGDRRVDVSAMRAMVDRIDTPASIRVSTADLA